MIPLDEAVAHVLAGCVPLPPVTVPAARAAGLVLADDVVAVEAVPPFANSAMDGYAVRWRWGAGPDRPGAQTMPRRVTISASIARNSGPRSSRSRASSTVARR